MGLDSGMTSRRKTTTPKPPMKWVDARQNSRLFGRASTFSSMVAPQVVNPLTDSNQALARVNGPPQRAYGSIPNMNDMSHERVIIT